MKKKKKISDFNPSVEYKTTQWLLSNMLFYFTKGIKLRK